MTSIQETNALLPDASLADSLEQKENLQKETEISENQKEKVASVCENEKEASEKLQEKEASVCANEEEGESTENLTQEEKDASENHSKKKKHIKTSEKQKETSREIPEEKKKGASVKAEPNKVAVVDGVEDGADTEFAAMEAELLDFEDSENVDKNSKNLDENGADKKLLDKDANTHIDKEDGACSEGELTDADLEEGELREPSLSSDTTDKSTRQVCRFFHRGVCYYGSACRFLHLTPNNKKGNYSMFPETTDSSTRTTSGYSHTNQHNLAGQRQPPPRVPEFVHTAPIPFCTEESAWEKGLREARNLLKQAHQKRKDPMFDQKKLNISININEKNIPAERERDHTHTHERIDTNDKREREERENFSNSGYDTYGDPHMYNERREKDSRDNRHHKRLSVERRFTKGGRNRNTHIGGDIERPFFHENYFDPWRRSKSPNRLSRERSHSSFSSYSSYSRSSSGSRSPASSHSSCRSSRSPSVQQKRKVSPVPETAVSPKVSSNRFGPVKKKPGPRTSSSRSRSVSRNSSRSRSRSISMDSVSSASSRNSTVSHSSSGGSDHEIKDLREKAVVPNPDPAPLDKFRGIGSLLNSKRDLLEEKFEDAPVEMDLRYLIPKIPEKKEPVRLALTHKNPIKLTLLNKFPQSKAGFSKDSKEFAVKKPDEPLKLNLLQGVKRPLSPSESAEPVKPTPVLLPKKSASSRRDELLKQLKAVEDAIARKRAKF